MPERYPVVAFIECTSVLGTIAAIIVAMWVFALGLEWRIAFWIGALIAIVGTIARTALRETPDFVDAKFQLKNRLEKANNGGVNLDSAVILKKDPIVNEAVNRTTSLAYFFIRCSAPVWLYFSYIHCGFILKHLFNYSAQQIIKHNLIVATIEFLTMVCCAYLSYKIHPLKIIKARINIFFVFIMFVPYLLYNATTVTYIFFIQIFTCLFQPIAAPATAVFFIHFPVFKRFRYASFLYALSRALMYVITSFGLMYLTKTFGYWGLLIIFIPVLIGVKFGVIHFEQLEKTAGNYLCKN